MTTREKMDRAHCSVPRPLPTVGQLPSGEYAVFNMQGTELWDKTFPTRCEAVAALCLYSMERRVKEDRF